MSEKDSGGEGPLASSLERMRQELDRWIESARSQGGKALDVFGLRAEHKVLPKLDLLETDEDIRVVMDLPGVDPHLIQVSIIGNMLTVKGHKPPTPTAADQTVHLNERSQGDFERLIPMPVPVDPDDISAESKNGVLTVLLMKSSVAKSRQIPVKSGSESESVIYSGN
jgi:HSP20 family protein